MTVARDPVAERSTSIGAGGPSRLPAAARRRQLTRVAIEVFSRRGYDSTSMDDIAEEAGVTKPVLYQHFRSKRSLYEELLEEVGSEMLQAIDEAVAAADGPRQQVEAGFTAYFRFVDERRSAFRLLFASGAPRDEELAGALQRVEETLADEVDSLIAADVEPSHRRVLAYAVVGMAEGASRHWLVPDRNRPAPDFRGPEGYPPLDPERVARHLADLAWAGLRAVHRD